MNMPGRQQPEIKPYPMLKFPWVKIGDMIVLGDKDYTYSLRVLGHLIAGLEVAVMWRETSAEDESAPIWFTHSGTVRLIGDCESVYRPAPGRVFNDGFKAEGQPYPVVANLPVEPHELSLELGRRAWMHIGSPDHGQQPVCITDSLTQLGIVRA